MHQHKLMTVDYDPNRVGALSGIRILDLSRLVAGNIASHVLADMGADVIKIEHPAAGDDLRNWRTGGIAAWWKVYCRNKRSVTLDLKTPEGKQLLLKLVANADALIENFTPGTLERWELGPEALLSANPGLVMLRLSGWGQSGPWSHKPGFGTLVEAMSGLAQSIGYEGQEPLLPPLALADVFAGLNGSSAVLAAIIARNGHLAGQGQVIDQSLFDAMFAALGPQAENYRNTATLQKRQGNRSDLTAPRNLYATADGRFLALSASMQGMFERLAHVIGRPDLIDDPRFKTNTARVENVEALDAIIGGYIGSKNLNDCLEVFESERITGGAVADISQLMNHHYVLGRESLVAATDGEGDETFGHPATARFSKSDGGFRYPAPTLGQHNTEILGDIGVSNDELNALKSKGIV